MEQPAAVLYLQYIQLENRLKRIDAAYPGLRRFHHRERRIGQEGYD
jgi:hypothetical protein